MKDQRKTKTQLIDELVTLRQHVASPEASGADGSHRDQVKQVEESLRASEERYRTLVELTPDAIVVHIDGKLVFANPAAARLLGAASAEDLIGEPVQRFVNPDYRELVAERMLSITEDGAVGPFMEEKIVRLDGRSVDAEIAGRRVMYSGEQAIQSVLRDMTDSKAAADSLRQSEELFRQIAESVREVLFIVDHKNYSVLYVNPAFEKIFGRTCESVYQDPTCWLDAIVSEDRERVNAALEEQQLTGEFNEEFRITRADGSIRWIYDRVIPIRDPTGKVYRLVGIAEDITERRWGENVVRESRERLRNLAARLHAVREEERTRIAREMHDELGQALTGVRMELHGLIDAPPEDLKVLVTRVDSAISLVDSTIENVRAMSWRLRPPILDDLGLEAAIEWHAEEFTSHSGLAVRLDLNLGERPLDTDRITTVFRILQEALTNVARHAEASNVEITLTESKDKLVLDVRDDGKGIAKRDVTSATALGLIGMRERAGTFGGRVVIRRTNQGGTQVKLTLPLEMKGG